MSSQLSVPPSSAWPGGAARGALDWQYGFAAAIELSPTVAVHSQDRNGIVRFWNKACAELFGIPAGEAIGQPFASLVSHLGREREFEEVLAAVWQTGGPVQAREWHVELRDGRRLWLYSNHFPVAGEGDGEAHQVFCMEVDLTARKELETALHRASQVFEHARDAILLVDREHRVLAANRAYTELTGYPAAEVVGALLPSLRLGVQDIDFCNRLRAHLDLHRHWEGELPCVRRDGSSMVLRAALSAMSDDGATTGYMVMLSDVSERRRAVEQARHQAEHDALTGLPNRILFMDRLEQALAAFTRQGRQFAIMFIDLDHFKAVNDGLGHEAGDAVLQEMANRMRRCVRRVDTVSRLGGDEFVVLLADIGAVDQDDHVAHAATTILQAATRPIEAGGQQASLSVSIGVAVCPADGNDSKTLLRHADVAMYHAKESGRNAFRFFSPEMNARVQERIDMEERLRRALERGEFELDYQPEIDLRSGHTVGFEALLRWRDPERGRLLPEAFIAAAEESGLIVPIGEWVLREACQQARRWRDAGFPVVVAVNLSNVQFLHDNLLGYVDAALQASNLAPEFLDLEITEQTIMSGDAATLATVDKLRQRGVRLTIDDFGTGLSSLSSLRRFPLSKLKIDRSFVEDIVSAPEGAAMIPAIIALARSLKLRVIAEGVETEEQLRYLRQHGCDEYQGFYAGGGVSAT